MKFQDYRLMKNKGTKTLIPKLRFPEFENAEEWNVEILSKVFTRITTKNKENNQNVLTISAQKGLISQLDYFNKSIAAKDVSGYYLINKGDFAYNKSYSQGYPMGAIKPLKYYDKGVVSTLYICFKINPGYNSSFFEQYFDAGMLNSKIEKIAQEGARNHGLLNINVNEFFNLELVLPQPSEQQNIADLLTSVEELITEQSNKIDALKAHKKGLMQQLFPSEGETVPKLRFPEFKDAGEWEKQTLGGITKKISRKNKDKTNYPIYSINNKEGFIPQSEQFVGIDGNSRGYDISLYKVVDKHTFAYNPARINVGSIGYSGELNNIIISSLYVCFKTTKQVNDLFIYHFFKTDLFLNFVNDNTEGGIRNYLFYENFSKITCLLPKDDEQQKIADCLSSLDDLIAEQNNKLTALQQHKKGLMQQVFPSI